jgi:ABC-type glutathione transport system ATPase component
VSQLLLKAQGLRKVFSSSIGEDTIALDQVDLEIYTGEVVALIGESGSGKTTLGRAVLRLLKLDEGEVSFDGMDLLALRGQELRRARRSFQMIFQNQQANLHPRLSVIEMLDESLRLHQPTLDHNQRLTRSRELLARVGLTDHERRYLASLSGGEQRRVGLARILATSPKLVVADEPTSGLDAAIKLQIIDLLRELRAESLSYLLISHDLELVRRIADRILVMLHGRIIEEIDIADLGKIQHHPYTRQLLNAALLGEGDEANSHQEHQDPTSNSTTREESDHA